MDNFALQIGLIVSFAVSLLLVVTTKWHGRFSLDGTAGVQKFHVVPTPRIGGVGIFLGLILACVFAGNDVQEVFAPILLAGVPAFVFGVAEDLTKRVSVRTRLLATMTSGLAAWALTGASITYTGIFGVDMLLTWLPVSVLFTAFAVGGVANSVNIIDGFNGLASGTVAICLIALGLIAYNAGDVVLGQICFLVCAVTFGFFVVNFPFGKLFLGDGGAYLLGFVLAWLAVMIAARNPSVSPWAPMLACAYPIFETLFTIVRRVWARSHPGEPDSHHLHSLVKVGISSRYLASWRADLRNASVSPISWIIAAVPAVLAVQNAQNTGTLWLCALVSFAVYLSVYWFVCTASRAGKPVAQNTIRVDVASGDAQASAQ